MTALTQVRLHAPKIATKKLKKNIGNFHFLGSTPQRHLPVRMGNYHGSPSIRGIYTTYHIPCSVALRANRGQGVGGYGGCHRHAQRALLLDWDVHDGKERVLHKVGLSRERGEALPCCVVLRRVCRLPSAVAGRPGAPRWCCHGAEGGPAARGPRGGEGLRRARPTAIFDAVPHLCSPGTRGDPDEAI